MKARLGPILLGWLTAAGICAAGAAAAGGGGASSSRTWHERVSSPAQFDLSLAEIEFGARAHLATPGAGASRRGSSIRIALHGTAGLDYVASALTRFSVVGRPRALVLVVNRRPRGSLAPDIASVGLDVTAPRRFGAPVLRTFSDPFTRAASGLTPALCDLPIRGPALAASDLRAVLGNGLALSGFGAAAAIAQAYDAVCGRPYDPAFRRAVTQGTSPGCQGGQSIVGCCPPNAMCLPPPCPPCPCGPSPCPVPVAGARRRAIACPLQSPPVPCPLYAGAPGPQPPWGAH
jgi:hypothetical protein